jgi:hypothetical protein
MSCKVGVGSGLDMKRDMIVQGIYFASEIEEDISNEARHQHSYFSLP